MRQNKKSQKNSDSIEIFEAGPFDMDQLALLFDSYRQFYKQPSDIEGARLFLSERLKCQDSAIFVACNEEGLIVGFTQLYPLFSSVSMQKSFLLNDLYVLPDFRGQGISRRLISRCKELAGDEGANGLYLETEKTNEAGNQLYPSEGFELNGSSNFYFWKCV